MSETSDRNVMFGLCVRRLKRKEVLQSVRVVVFQTLTCQIGLYKWSFDCQDYHEKIKS